MTNYVFLAEGFEELEAIAVIDMLRRAGMNVNVVSAAGNGLEVAGAHGLVVKAESFLADIEVAEADRMILPGGYDGTMNLAACEPFTDMLAAHFNRGGKVAAICAAPSIVLAPLGLLKGRKATCYPGMEEPCVAGGAVMAGCRAVVDGNLITGNGPASAIEFASAVITDTVGAEAAAQVEAGMLYDRK